MGAPSYAGYWTGTFEGTNQGGVTVDLQEAEGRLTGVARFSEPALGQYAYTVRGVGGETLSLRLTPSRGQGTMALGELQIVGGLSATGELSGRWKSSIGTEGVFHARRHESTVHKESLPKANSVFLVHGHDDGAKHAVARFLEQLGSRRSSCKSRSTEA